MSVRRFTERIDEYSWEEVRSRIYGKTGREGELALGKSARLTVDDFTALVSPAAEPYLERMAALSRNYTRQRFGKTIQFYLPLYLTNSCTNHCVYCGFNHNNDIRRIILNREQVLREVEAIKQMGDFQHLLLVTGENSREAGAAYIEQAIEWVKPYFASISMEVQPMQEEEYARRG